MSILYWMGDQPGQTSVHKVRKLASKVQDAFNSKQNLETWICLYCSAIQDSGQRTTYWYLDCRNTLESHGITLESEYDADPLIEELGWKKSETKPSRIEDLPYLSALLSDKPKVIPMNEFYRFLRDE